jgi:transposase
LLDQLEWHYPQARFTKVYVVVDNYGIHKAKAVERWLAAHSRFELLFLPTYCPKANPIERAFGDVHDKCTRNHQRHYLDDLVWDVEQHLVTNGPWSYHLSQLYYTPEVTAALERLTREPHLEQAA